MLQILSFQDFKMIQTLKYFHFLFSRKWSTNWSQWAQTTVQPRFAIFSCKSQLRSRCLEFIKSKKSLTIIRFKPLYCDSRWTMWWQLDKSWMRRWCPSWATWRWALCKMMMMMMLSYYIYKNNHRWRHWTLARAKRLRPSIENSKRPVEPSWRPSIWPGTGLPDLHPFHYSSFIMIIIMTIVMDHDCSQFFFDFVQPQVERHRLCNLPWRSRQGAEVWGEHLCQHRQRRSQLHRHHHDGQVTYVEVEEKSDDDLTQCLVQLSTLPVAVINDIVVIIMIITNSSLLSKSPAQRPLLN